MDVFDLDASLLSQDTRFARSFTRIRSVELDQKVNALYAGRRFWPEPLLQLNPHYERGGSVQALVGPSGGPKLLPRGLPAVRHRHRGCSYQLMRTPRVSAWALLPPAISPS